MNLFGAASSEGFAVNLIRAQVPPAWIRRSLASAVVAVSAFNAFLCLWLVGSSLVFLIQSSRLQGKFQGQLSAPGSLQALKDQALALTEQGEIDRAQISAALNLQRQHFPVSSKLAVLAKTLPPRIWISQVSGERADRSMDIQAVYLVAPSSPERLPAKQWIEAVRADPVFRNGLKSADLKSANRKSQRSGDLFFFEVAAEWAR